MWKRLQLSILYSLLQHLIGAETSSSEDRRAALRRTGN